MPLFCWFHHFLDSRAKICHTFSLVFWSKWWHQKDILKLTDLQRISKEFPKKFLVFIFIGNVFKSMPSMLCTWNYSEIDFIWSNLKQCRRMWEDIVKSYRERPKGMHYMLKSFKDLNLSLCILTKVNQKLVL